MNLRILKKLSKRAAPLLPLLGDHREQFRSEKDDNYHGLIIRARKHWERMRCHPSHQEKCSDSAIIYTSRTGHRISMRTPYHPRKGTIMVGAMQGYYEPEWDEESAYGALLTAVIWHFTDYSDPDHLRPTRSTRTPHEVFAAAAEMIREREGA